MLLIDLLNRSFCLHRIVSAGYKASILNAISALKKKLGREPSVADLCDDGLNDLAASLLDQRLSRPTVNRIVRTLCVLARYARRKRLTEYRPDVERLPEPELHPKAWQRPQFQGVLNGIVKRFGVDTLWGRRLRAVVLLNYDTGFRIIDVVRMPMIDCDLVARVVRVVEQKTGKRRAMTIHQRTIAAVESLWELTGKPRLDENVLRYPYVETQPLRKRLRASLRAAGLPNTRRDLFQRIRRTTINEGKAAGLDPTEIAGHSSRWVTIKYYEDADFAPPLDVANKLPGIMGDDLPPQIGAS